MWLRICVPSMRCTFVKSGDVNTSITLVYLANLQQIELFNCPLTISKSHLFAKRKPDIIIWIQRDAPSANSWWQLFCSVPLDKVCAITNYFHGTFLMSKNYFISRIFNHCNLGERIFLTHDGNQWFVIGFYVNQCRFDVIRKHVTSPC